MSPLRPPGPPTVTVLTREQADATAKLLYATIAHIEITAKEQAARLRQEAARQAYKAGWGFYA